jgi:hypothetical protein
MSTRILGSTARKVTNPGLVAAGKLADERIRAYKAARTTEVKFNGRWLRPGVEVSIKGERGRFRFHHLVTAGNGDTYVTVWGGPSGHGSWRSFAPDRIKAVHAKEKMR